MTDWKDKIEAQITFLRDHVCSGPMHENPEVTEVSANTMQALLDEIERLRAALQNVMAYGLESHGLSDPGILLMIWSIADKALREADDGH